MDDWSQRNLSSIDSWLDSEPWKKWKRIGLTGLAGSSKAYLLSRWREKMRGPLLVIVPHLRNAETLLEDLRFFAKDSEIPSFLFPPWEILPYDDIPPHPEITRERVKVLFSLLKGEEAVIVSSIKALMQKVLAPVDLKESVFSLSVGEEIDRDRIIHFLREGGYVAAKIVEERGDFSVRGAIIDLSTPFYEEPLRLEFDGDRLESIRRFETETQRSLSQGMMDHAILLPTRDVSRDAAIQPLKTLFDYLEGNEIVFIEEGDEVEKEAETFSRLIEEHYKKALFKKKAVSPPETTYLRDEEVSLCLEKFRRVYLQGGPFAPSPRQPVFSFEMETHENLQREMKTVLAAKTGFPETSPFSLLLKNLHDWQAKGMGVFVVSHTAGQADRLRELFSEYGVEPRLEKAMRFREAL